MSSSQSNKSVFDFILSFFILVLVSPVLILASFAVKISSKGPILFRQTRVGQYGIPFQVLKLRTMREAKSGPLVTSETDDRITPVGVILRRFKIDELPQFINVLKGDMAIVGPRPEVPRYVDLEDPKWQKILEQKPGITSPVAVELQNESELLASIPGDTEQAYLEVVLPYKMNLYLEHGQNRSFLNDLRVIGQTFMGIFVKPTLKPGIDIN